MNIMSGTNEEYKRKIDLLVAYNELYEENTQLKQDKQELIEFLKKQIETKKQHNAFNKHFYEIKEIEAFLEKLGE